MNKTNHVLNQFLIELNEQNQKRLDHLPLRRDIAQFADEMFGFLFGLDNQQVEEAPSRHAILMEKLSMLLQPFAIDSVRVIVDFQRFYQLSMRRSWKMLMQHSRLIQPQRA